MPTAICPPREAGACSHRTPASWHRRLMSSLAEEGLSDAASTTTTNVYESRFVGEFTTDKEMDFLQQSNISNFEPSEESIMEVLRMLNEHNILLRTRRGKTSVPGEQEWASLLGVRLIYSIPSDRGKQSQTRAMVFIDGTFIEKDQLLIDYIVESMKDVLPRSDGKKHLVTDCMSGAKLLLSCANHHRGPWCTMYGSIETTGIYNFGFGKPFLIKVLSNSLFGAAKSEWTFRMSEKDAYVGVTKDGILVQSSKEWALFTYKRIVARAHTILAFPAEFDHSEDLYHGSKSKSLVMPAMEAAVHTVWDLYDNNGAVIQLVQRKSMSEELKCVARYQFDYC